MRESSQTQQHFRFGLFLAIFGTALFALKSIFIKFAYQSGIDTVTLLTLRMVIAMPFYLAILIWLLAKEKRTAPPSKTVLKVLFMGFWGYYLASYLDMEGLNYISAQLERLTLYTYPIITTLLGWFFLKEIVTRRIALALLLTYSGVLLLYFHESLMIGWDASIGVLLVAGAALSYSIYVVFSKGLIMQLGSRLFTSIAMLSSTVFVLIHFSLTHDFKDLISYPEAWGYAFLLAIFSTLLPSFMLTEAIARIGAAKTSIVGTVGPVFTILLAVILLGEPFGWMHLAGMLLVLFGVSLLRK